ncbi:MAG: VaFE repeat-containing surface-anchored protein [Eubacterium sp.]|nr:VaFE repeat-containing surface-anchored protein [Eubacterium sp.]
MLRKTKTLFKRVIAFLLSALMLMAAVPLSASAASENLGRVAGGSDMDVAVSWHYGHQLHTTTKNGTTYPLFCIEYGTTSPSSSYLKARKAGASAKVITAAKWIFAGYYLEHGNDIDWKDMAMCQKKVWSIMGDSTSWDFSSSDYDDWIENAEKNMKSLDTKPSFHNTNVGTITAGTSKTITDSNKVFKDYPAFTINKNGIKMVHEADTNKLVITIDKTCTKTSFKINNGDYYKENTGDDDELLLFYPYGSEDYQKLVYSAYYDPISFALDGNIEVLGSAKLKKTSEDGKVSGIKFTITGDDFSKTMTTDSNGEWELDYLVPGKYTVTEESIERYVTPSSKTITVKSGETASVSFSNILKKFRVTVSKEDAEKKNAQGDATLAGATYGIYNGGTLVDTYTTDSNGKFTTSYYVCGDNWTVKEISPSEGYLLDKSVYNVGAQARLYTVEYNTTSNTVKEQVIKGNISIIKHSDDGSTQIETPEPEAEFQVYLKSAGSYANANSDERDILDCNNDGFAQSKDLPYGVYTVHQTKGVDGSEFIQDFDVFIAENGKTYKYLINNAPFKAYLKITKVDRETRKAVAYAGAGFEIYDSSGKKVSQTFTYPKKTTISTYYTNSDGYLITPEKLDYGKNYTLVEVQAPYGYVVDNTPIKFNVTRDNSEYEDALTIIKVNRDNIAQKGIVEITKSGEVFASAENTDNIYTPVYEEQNLKGAVFDVFAAEDIVTPDGTLRYQQGEQVDEITTGDVGIAKTRQLYLGKYTVVEKTAPDTFYNSNQQYDVELIYAGQEVAVTSTALSAFNERQRVKLSLIKSIEKDKIYKIGDSDEIEAVQFGIYAAVDVTAADGSVIPANSLITIGNCNKDGNIVFDCDLPIGFIWYAQEIATDKHYVLSNEQYFFDTMYAGQSVDVLDIVINEGNPVENKLIYGKVKGYKIDRETQKPIKNVVFGIFKSDETEFTYKTAITTAKTDKNGVFEFNNVPYGAWIIRELKAADGYLDYTDIHHIEIDRNEKVIEMNIVNDKIPELKTTASVDGKKTVSTKKAFTITDTVEYQHLIPGKEYTVKGVLMDKSTGKELVVDSKIIKSEVTFVPEAPSGTVDVTFTIDGKFITKTTDIVVFETLYKEGVELASHADIKDEGQTVTVKVTVKKTKIPKTGDDRDYRTLVTILGGSIFAALCLAYYLIRKKKKEGAKK